MLHARSLAILFLLVSLPTQAAEALRPGPVVTGTVTGPGGRPVSGAAVVLTRVIGETFGQGSAQELERQEARTGPDGRFAIRGLPAFDLRIDHPDFATLVRQGIVASDASGTTDLGLLTLETGRALEGIVVDGEDRPLAGVAIWISDPEPAMLLTGEESRRGPRQVTGPDGKFSIGHLQSWSFGVYACHPDRSGFVQSLDEALPRPFRIVLPASGRLPGRVVDPEGRPVAGAYVSASIPGYDPGDLVDIENPCPRADQSAWAVTDGEGRFLLKPIAQGSFDVSARADGWLNFTTKGMELGGKSGPRSLDIVLQRPLRRPSTSTSRGREAQSGGGTQLVTQVPQV